MIDFSADKPNFISAVLEKGSAIIDVVDMVARISPIVSVPLIQGTLSSVIHQSELQCSLLNSCESIFIRDAVELLSSFIGLNKKPQVLCISQSCSQCNMPIFHQRTNLAGNAKMLYIFFCGHSFHANCLTDDGDQSKTNIEHALKCVACNNK